MLFGFDGFGVNDYAAEYKPRIATLTAHGHALKAGPVLAAAPELLEALKACLCCLQPGRDDKEAKAARRLIRRIESGIL